MALEARSSAILRFGVFEVDVRSGELRKQGVRIKLQEQPFHVLAVLLQRPGEVVTREQLRSENWSADTFVDFDHSLNKAINKLREALGDSADNPRFIETLAKRGYRFIRDRQEGPRQIRSLLVLPLGKPVPRSRARVLRGWPHRRVDNEAGENRCATRVIADYRNALQGRTETVAGDRPGVTGRRHRGRDGTA